MLLYPKQLLPAVYHAVPEIRGLPLRVIIYQIPDLIQHRRFARLSVDRVDHRRQITVPPEGLTTVRDHVIV